MTTASTNGSHSKSTVIVKELVSSRYPNGQRPESWDERREGVDVIKTSEGHLLNLWSDGGQSPPKQGWQLMLMGGDELKGLRWTLYGLPRT